MRELAGWTKELEIDIEKSIKPDFKDADLSSLVAQPEVYQIGNNEYTYEEAKALCASKDADLASYSQIEDAYKNGAEWCSYGWSKDQLALFPTQKSTYDRLKQGCGKDRFACGRPGINGGYIANPNVRFSANCYGVKPNPTKQDLKYMNAKIITPEQARISKLEKIYEKESIRIKPFKTGTWSEMEEAPVTGSNLDEILASAEKILPQPTSMHSGKTHYSFDETTGQERTTPTPTPTPKTHDHSNTKHKTDDHKSKPKHQTSHKTSRQSPDVSDLYDKVYGKIGDVKFDLEKIKH